jgi:hypothetical protein
MFERVVTLLYLRSRPNDAQRFLNYYWVSRRKYENAIETTFKEGLVNQAVLEETKENYDKVKDDYKMTLCDKCGTTRPGIAWSPTDMVTMAKEVALGDMLVPATRSRTSNSTQPPWRW